MNDVFILKFFCVLWLLAALVTPFLGVNPIFVSTYVIMSSVAGIGGAIVQNIWRATARHMKHNHDLMEIALNLINVDSENNADDA
tara:strand:+ start:259 stop:513 length:255 start_codon:yes stop_codon:yes gene_type:complete